MNSGDFREKITFRTAASVAEDGGGQQTVTPGDVSPDPDVWARVEVINTSESIDGQQREAIRGYRFTVRRRVDVVAQDVIKWTSSPGAGDMLLEITAVDISLDPKRLWTTIEAVEREA